MKAASKANHNNSYNFIILDDLDGCFLVGTGHVFNTNNVAEHTLACKSHHSVSVVKYFLDSDSYKHKKHLPVDNALPFSITKSTKQTMCDTGAQNPSLVMLCYMVICKAPLTGGYSEALSA